MVTVRMPAYSPNRKRLKDAQALPGSETGEQASPGELKGA